MSESANLLGLPAEFSFDGHTLAVVPVDFEIEGLFERFLESEARRAIERHRADMDPAEYQGQLDGWRRDCAAHIYAWGSPFFATGFCSPQGQKELAYLRLKKANPSMSAKAMRAMIDRIFRDEEAFEALRAAMEASDPPAKAPKPSQGAGAETGAPTRA